MSPCLQISINPHKMMANNWKRGSCTEEARKTVSIMYISLKNGFDNNTYSIWYYRKKVKEFFYLNRFWSNRQRSESIGLLPLSIA